MVFPVYGPSAGAVSGPDGHSYAAVLVRDGDPAEVLAALRRLRFSGWLARQPEQGWLPAVAASGAGTVAAGRRGVIGVAEALAGTTDAPVLAIRVVIDRQLMLAMWAEGAEAGRYVSNPAKEPGADDDLLDEPLGEEHADVFAALCEHPDAGDDLGELLGEELDPESTIESERLGRVARLLGLPTWLVAASTLPRDIPTGPGRRDLTRLGAGVPYPPGLVIGWAINVVRKRRPPPPAIADPPRRTGGGMDPWLM